MILNYRISLLARLGDYMQNNGHEWQTVKAHASRMNPWFVPEFIEMASANIALFYLRKNSLEEWVRQYAVPEENKKPFAVGVVMAGNIPMVGFHDMLCIFITGHRQIIKLSSKDDILIKHLVAVLTDWEPDIADYISFRDNLKGCDAYIATGSNNSSRYFEYYFGRFPHIIRRNRTSVAILDGTELREEMDKLADDIQTYFGLGCRNVTKLYVPENYKFDELLNALNKYNYYEDFHKYKHNYDYQLALLMMGNKFYMTNGSILFTEDPAYFSPVSQVNYEYYSNNLALGELKHNEAIQCLIGRDYIPFGQAQKPLLTDYADGVDTIQFALAL